MKMTRYFHYLSRSKVEMLFDQLDQSVPSRMTRFGVDLKLLNAQHERASESGEPTIFAKLDAVEEAINRTERPGTVGDDTPYVRSRQDLWASVLPSRQADMSETVLFCGEARGHDTSFVLGGSASHMLPGIYRQAGSGLNSNFLYLQREVFNFLSQLQPPSAEVEEHDDAAGDDDPLSSDMFMYDSIRYLSQICKESKNFTYVGYCEFLARVISRVAPDDSGWGPNAVLATPLYVCQIEVKGTLQW